MRQNISIKKCLSYINVVIVLSLIGFSCYTQDFLKILGIPEELKELTNQPYIDDKHVIRLPSRKVKH